MALVETVATLVGAGVGLVTGVGGMWVRTRRARLDERQADTEHDRLALEARDSHLSRLEREIARLDSALGDARDDHAECTRLHRECTTEAARLAARVAHLEERVDQVEQRSGDSTPVPSERT